MPGSWIFGPKFGPFFQNIHGNTPPPKGEAPDYYTQWLTPDVHWTRGHKYRAGVLPTAAGKVIKDQPTQSERVPMFFAAQKAAEAGRHTATNTPAAVQSVDWFATKSLPGLFGVPIDLASFVHGANKVLKDRGHGVLEMNDDGTLKKPMPNLAPRRAGLANRDQTADTSKLARAPDQASHDGMLEHAIESRDPHALGVLGDYYEENGLPGHGLLRAAHEQVAGHSFNVWNPAHGPEQPVRGGGDWASEEGEPASLSQWNPHATEAHPFWTQNGLYLNVLHSGDDPLRQLRYTVHVPDAASFNKVTADLPQPMRDHLLHSIRSGGIRRHNNIPSPVRLARTDAPSYTYVGGHVPQGMAALGFWTGGAEKSSVVTVPPKVDPAAMAQALAARNKQKTALWFTPGAGADALHVLSVQAPPKDVHRGLVKHGVSEMTIIPNRGGSWVHVVDQGGALADSVKAYAAEARAKLESTPGTAGYAKIQ